MVVGTDVFEPKGSTIFPLITEGVVLDSAIIGRLRGKAISYVLIEVPKGYRGAPGEVLELYSVKDDILFDGRLEIHKGIDPELKIDAGESLVIKGDIAKGCVITSRTGNISLKGSINGTKECPVKIHVSGNLVIQGASAISLNFVEIKAGGEVSSTVDILDSVISAGGDINIDGRIIRTELFSDTRLKVKDSGDEDFSQCLLAVNPADHFNLSQVLLKLDRDIAEMEKERAQLQDMVSLFKKMGGNVKNISPEKKLELAAGLTRFKGIEESIPMLQEKRLETLREMETSLAVKRIIITGDLFPGTKVIIENNSTVIDKKQRCMAFYVKDGRMRSTPYSNV